MKLNDINTYIDDRTKGLFTVGEKFFPRERLVQRIMTALSSQHITVLVGIRRAGKSFLFRLLAKKLIEETGANTSSFFFLNFEDPDLIDFAPQDAAHLRTILSRDTSRRQYLFCDEIQALPHADRVLQSLQEIPNLSIIVTGSNAKLLSKEISTLLTGRHTDIFVPTLQYHEFCELQPSLSDCSFETYMHTPGFPQIALSNEHALVKQYFSDIVEKDIFARHRMYTNQNAVLKLYIYILSNIKNLCSVADITEAVKDDIASKTSVGKFLAYLEDTFVISPIKNYHYSLKKRYRDKTKYYTLDNGFIREVGDYVLDPRDTLFENALFRELYARFPDDVYFLKRSEKKYDIDFYIPSKHMLVNATLGFQVVSTKKREVDSLFSAQKDLKMPTEAFVVTLDEPEENITRESYHVNIVPITTFLKNLDAIPT